MFLIVTDVDTNLKGEGNQLKNSLKSKQNKHIEKGKVLKKTILNAFALLLILLVVKTIVVTLLKTYIQSFII